MCDFLRDFLLDFLRRRRPPAIGNWSPYATDAERFVQGQKDYQAAMFRDYKAGKLDPKPGEPGRKRLLEKKMEEMEMSGDKKLMTQDEIDELMMLQTEELATQMTERMHLKIK